MSAAVAPPADEKAVNIQPVDAEVGQDDATLKGVTASDDVARAYYLQAKDEDISVEEQRRVLRKIDLHMLPMLSLTALMQYLDKTTINYSANYGLREGLGMVGSQYSWASSIFFFGALFWQYPSLLIMQRLPVGRYFASQVFCWGALTLLMAVSSNFGGFAALRFLLGATESIQLAACFIISSMYYTREEQPIRLMAWYAMNPVATILGSLFAYGVGYINSPVALWKFPFIICGALSTAWAIALWFMLPSNPATAWFLKDRERLVAIKRVENNNTGMESKKFKKDQAIEAFLDPKVWLIAISVGAGNILAGLGLFSSLVIRGFGFDQFQTALLQMPAGGIDIVALFAFTLAATYIPNSRLAFSILAGIIALVGTVMLYAFEVQDRWAQMAGMWILKGFIPVGFLLSMTSTNGNIAGHTKKLTTQAIIFVCHSTGSLVGPQLYTTPPYRQGLQANIVAVAVTVLCGILLLLYLIWENKKRREFLEANRHLLNEEDYKFRDLTDKQNPFCFNKL
ncbi:allantoate permease [Plectosphaerella plurivora]|uniref:Allantoate permease n=1 Tax=Plectosphaerella plurivora TaxID=936078 RepID=A0A9P8V131_9PEZI|nr:allantoate permease [Plectosphaerella plurivora]